MTTPAVADKSAAPPAPVIQGKVSYPSAIAGQVPSAVYKFGQVLKEIIHAVPTAFSNENDLLAALTTLDDFVKAFVPVSNLAALADVAARAPIEDVSKRTPPAGVSYSIPSNTPAIDYDKLAAALVRAQMAIAAENQPEPVPAPAPANPAQAQETPQYG